MMRFEARPRTLPSWFRTLKVGRVSQVAAQLLAGLGATSAYWGCGDEPGSGASQNVIPLIAGIPIGDCHEPTAEEQAASGCPVIQPAAQSACDAREGTVCHYEIRLTPVSSSQVSFFCRDGSWGPGALQQCGVACAVDDSNVVELGGTACGRRPLLDCAEETGFTYAYRPPAQGLLNNVFQQAVETCSGGPITDNGFQLQVAGGCPTRLSSSRALTPAVLECLKARLESTRWDCATQLLCASYVPVAI